jgi:hypothetical protein
LLLVVIALALVLASFVAADDAAGSRTENAMMTRIVTDGAADDGTLEAALGVGRSDHRDDEKGNGNPRANRLHYNTRSYPLMPYQCFELTFVPAACEQIRP